MDEAKENITNNEVKETVNTVDEAYDNLKKNGRNSVDNLVKWMKQTNVIDDTKEAESATKKLFDDVNDKKNIQLDKFKEVIAKLAQDVKQNPADLMKKLTSGISQVEGAVKKATQFIRGMPNAFTGRDNTKFSEEAGSSQEQWKQSETTQQNGGVKFNEPGNSEEQERQSKTAQDNLNEQGTSDELNEYGTSDELHDYGTSDELNEFGTAEEQSLTSVQTNESNVATQDEAANESGSLEELSSSPRYSSAPTDNSD